MKFELAQASGSNLLYIISDVTNVFGIRVQSRLVFYVQNMIENFRNAEENFHKPGKNCICDYFRLFVTRTHSSVICFIF